MRVLLKVSKTVDQIKFRDMSCQDKLTYFQNKAGKKKPDRLTDRWVLSRVVQINHPLF